MSSSVPQRRIVPIATYASLVVIGAVYTLASWAMSVHYGNDQVAAVAGQQGPGMLFAMSSDVVAEIATVLFMTSLSPPCCVAPVAPVTDQAEPAGAG